ncbi:hypothetical protein NLU13_6220 [Sarocladium strictum]|uniref:GXWXG protein n=1 Tax=Sarocladium strictum TaxID=5046 RepID=A0AA39GGS4_SARSR|nr:hypothetical protein NLU13_6220 [Sarocladium strictum]
MAQSARERLRALIQKGGRVEETAIAAIFDALPPVSSPASIIGEWQGGSFDTGHPSHALLAKINWAGKTFRSLDDVDPVVVFRNGERAPRKSVGGARLREVKFRGVVSTAMVYDELPIIDSFRFVSDGMLLGAMDSKLDDSDGGTYYFYLMKLRAKL